ncbi:MAG TPA: aminomethyl-transferring glycine dehydrogenase, partial [Phycisphaerales bacterium]|nr:aminomethyl-transferring glycine dehydrogenase [Phycisphaerales bacterium]
MTTIDTPTTAAKPTMTTPTTRPLAPLDTFVRRHIGPRESEVAGMLRAAGFASMEGLIGATVPKSIRLKRPMTLSAPADRVRGEAELLAELRAIARQNEVFRSCIGMGYHGTVTPGVILRNIMENPGWYTQYTPYQSEISQGRLEALLNFQTMVSDLTALPVAGASLLDEGTAAAEAMAMCFASAGRARFFIADDCHPQTIEVVRTRAASMGVEVVVGDARSARIDESLCGVLVQYPTTDGRVECYRQLAQDLHARGGLLVAAVDLLALTLLTPPGEWGADIAVGSAQRFGVPMGFGGPHAAFLATTEALVRRMPGRIIGVSRDATGRPAYRMAIQTREQHIKRERATSNICTAQALLAIMAGMYAVYHGPEGLRAIAGRVRLLTQTLRAGLLGLGHHIGDELVFDTLRVRPAGRSGADVLKAARERRINLRDFGDGSVGVTLDETSDAALVADLLAAFGQKTPAGKPPAAHLDVEALTEKARVEIAPAFARTSPYLTHPVFNTRHSETEMLRYIFELQGRDLSLAHAMIPLGSCTMKLNATSEMIPVTWPEFGAVHPFAPAEQTRGYRELFAQLESWLAEITGFAAVSLQPNAGSQGEYAGLLVIRAYHEARGEAGRDVCLIPASAHGTNPASAVIAGMKVVVVACDENGNIDVADLRTKAEQHRETLSALMVTYPSTHGVFEESITEICAIVHEFGGQVYMDGANMNAQVGLTSPGAIGADVCHLNLHKTFCIPHGGGGPGMGPIGVARHLAPYLPGHPVVSPFGGEGADGRANSALGSRSEQRLTTGTRG